MYSIRSIPALLSDKNNPEDVDSALDDHAADTDRYFVMSRPAFSVPKEQDKPLPVNSWGWWRGYHEKLEKPTGVLA